MDMRWYIYETDKGHVSGPFYKYDALARFKNNGFLFPESVITAFHDIPVRDSLVRDLRNLGKTDALGIIEHAVCNEAADLIEKIGRTG